MKIAIASGKGGTGKTTVATNLVRAAGLMGRRVAYLDCDVEEPNGGIFLQPTFAQEQDIARRIPEVDSARCRQCGQCGQCEYICQFHAIVCLGESVLVFPELCHSCGGCSLVCPTEAIHEVSRLAGRLRIGACGQVHFVDGVLNVGEHLSPPAIRAVKQAAPAADLVVLDAPPGTSCPAVEAVRDSDFVVLVTEPTPFGVHDLKLAAQMVRALGLPFGVVVNRADLGNGEVERYCAQTRKKGEQVTVIRRQYEEAYRTLRQQNHPTCIVCGDGVGYGLAMEFRTPRHGLIEATFACERALEGYPDVLHGGVICALLDGAMTNCLFACGVVAVTGDLRVRFRLPVATSGRAAVRAWVESSSRPLHKLAAELIQDGQIKATATAKFVERTAAVRSEKESAER